MREIEIKAKVTDKQALVDAIARNSVQLSAPIKQHDIVFGRADEVFEGYDVLLNKKKSLVV